MYYLVYKYLWVRMTCTCGYLDLQKPVDHLQTCGSPANLQVEIRMGLKPVGHDWPQEI